LCSSRTISRQSLQVAELDCGRLRLQNFPRIREFLRGFEFSCSVNNFARRSRFGFRLLGDGALHLLGDVDLFHLDFGNLDAQGSVSVSRIIWSLALNPIALREDFIDSNCPTTLRMVVCASCEVAYV